MKPLDSSAIAAAGYDPATATLHLMFHSGPKVYRYHPWSPEEHDDFLGADSHGKHFHAHIRGREVA